MLKPFIKLPKQSEIIKSFFYIILAILLTQFQCLFFKLILSIDFIKQNKTKYFFLLAYWVQIISYGT